MDSSYSIFYENKKRWIIVRETRDEYMIHIECEVSEAHAISKTQWEGTMSAGLLSLSPAIMCKACGLQVEIRSGQMKDL